MLCNALLRIVILAMHYCGVLCNALLRRAVLLCAHKWTKKLLLKCIALYAVLYCLAVYRCKSFECMHFSALDSFILYNNGHNGYNLVLCMHITPHNTT